MRTHAGHDQSGVTLIEMLVVMIIMGVVMAAITSVVITTQRSNSTQQTMQDVIDDGRNSLTAIRRELRSARRVLPDSASDRLHFWVDTDQDAIPDPEEQICYAVEPIGSGARYRIMRWDHATGGCEPGNPPSGVTPRILAQTLTDPNAFAAFRPVPSPDINDPATREVDIILELEVDQVRSSSTTVKATVRLRNVA